jgi:hypothetical protein
MTKPLADRRKTHPCIHQFGGMRMTQLVERAGDASGSTILLPPHLHRLVAHGAAAPILLRTEERPVLIAHLAEVGVHILHQPPVIKQHRPPLAPLGDDRDMFVIEGEIEILNIEADCRLFTDDGARGTRGPARSISTSPTRLGVNFG